MRSYEMNVETAEELSAVNDILASIGESPVSTLEGDSNADVANARRILNKINVEVQAKGWTFNIETGETLTPDVYSKLIPYMSDYLSVLSSGGQSVYVNRGGYVYDRTAKTDQFTSPITVDLIRLRGLDEMPTCFRSWIVAKAARQFNSRFFGAPEVEGSLALEEADAKISCMEYELDFGAYNMMEGDSFVGGLLSR